MTRPSDLDMIPELVFRFLDVLNARLESLGLETTPVALQAFCVSTIFCVCVSILVLLCICRPLTTNGLPTNDRITVLKLILLSQSAM